MTMAGPYTTYIVAAYAVSAILLLGMVWRTWSGWRQAQKNWQVAQKLTQTGDVDV